MKKIFLILLVWPGMKVMAQNIGIGTTDPKNKLHTIGSFLVTAPSFATTTPPTPAQTRTMINGMTIAIPFSDSTTRLYDPGGPAGNYNSNLNAVAAVDDQFSVPVGIEVTLEAVQLGTGDSLIIRETAGSVPFLAVGNNYSLTGKWVFSSNRLHILFKSNADASNGSGFSMLLRRLYDNSASLPDVTGFTGGALLFDSKKAALRGGIISNAPIGLYSNALGYNCAASGNVSVALGFHNVASGFNAFCLGNSNVASGTTAFAIGGATNATADYAVAMGYGAEATADYAVAIGASNEASGMNAVALGQFNIASGDNATAMGYDANATGDHSTAIGRIVTASGNYSTAMGNYVSTNGQSGCFTIGDNSTTSVMTSPSANNFRARFANGYRLYTSADYSTSCSLGAGDNAWTTSSDMRLKENFVPVDGETILKKIALMPLTTWNYKNQDPSRFRHYGPMAQDFHAAFGKDIYGTIGSDTTINQADFDGVNFIAIQALEKRTMQQQALIEVLLKKIEQLEAERPVKKEKANRRKKSNGR